MKIPIIIAVTLLLSMKKISFSQQIFEDASGETTFYVSNNKFGWLKINSSSTSFNVGYNYAASLGAGWQPTYGFNAKINAKDGIGTVLKGAQLNPGFNLGGFWGLGSYNFLKNLSYITVYTRFNATYNGYKIINNITTASPEVKDEKVWGFQGLIHLNARINGSINSVTKAVGTYHFIGLSTGYKRGDNYSLLDEVQITTPVFSNTSMSISKIATGRIGPYKQSSSMAFNFDYGILPTILGQRVVGFNTYLRTEFFNKPLYMDGGFGLFFSKIGAPSSVIGGIAWQFNDFTNGVPFEKTAFERSSIFFYIGYTINN